LQHLRFEAAAAEEAAPVGAVLTVPSARRMNMLSVSAASSAPARRR
jgi:hypothetical protein